jgi:hypothetical protein
MPTMPEESNAKVSALETTRSRLLEIANFLRHSRSLDPAARQALGDLVAELTQALASENLPAAELTHLAEQTARLAEALHREEDEGVVSKARSSLERAVEKAEAKAPRAVGLARKVLDALANIGI